MKALISPTEISYSYDKVELGVRVAEVAEVDFPVAQPLFWVDCPDNCVADAWYYFNGELQPKPIDPNLSS
jgi:hypothetical protein